MDARPAHRDVRLTVTVKRALAVFADRSLAVHVTAVRPGPNQLPERGVQDAGLRPSTTSLAVTE